VLQSEGNKQVNSMSMHTEIAAFNFMLDTQGHQLLLRSGAAET